MISPRCRIILGERCVVPGDDLGGEQVVAGNPVERLSQIDGSECSCCYRRGIESSGGNRNKSQSMHFEILSVHTISLSARLEYKMSRSSG